MKDEECMSSDRLKSVFFTVVTHYVINFVSDLRLVGVFSVYSGFHLSLSIVRLNKDKTHFYPLVRSLNGTGYQSP
jgi:hypothetical protein